ncbi:unnamed protein product [Trichobilharzia szidati]|nr:unnamed protein product [Trichobilharzia szidati]
MQHNEEEDGKDDVVNWARTLHQSINRLKIDHLTEILNELNLTKGLEFTKNVINCQVDGVSSIYAAVEAGFEDAVTQLLNTGLVNITQRCQHNNWTCLHLACHLGLATMVKLILKHHTEVNVHQLSTLYRLACMQTNENESTGQGTVLHLTIQSKNLETLNQLLHDVSVISKLCENQCLEGEKKTKEAVNMKNVKLFDEFCTLTDKNGNTALHCAVIDKLYDMVSIICKYHNKSIRLPNKHGYTCIYIAKNIMKDVKMLSLLVNCSTSSLVQNNNYQQQNPLKQMNSVKSSKYTNANQLKKSNLNVRKKPELIKATNTNNNCKNRKVKKSRNPLNHLTLDQLNKNFNSNFYGNKFYAFSHHNEDCQSVRTLSTKFSYLSMNQKYFRPLSGLSGNRMDLNERESSRNVCQSTEHVINAEYQMIQKQSDTIKKNLIQNESPINKCSDCCNNELHIINTLHKNLVSKSHESEQLSSQLKTGNLIKNEDFLTENTPGLNTSEKKGNSDDNNNNMNCSNMDEDDSDDYYRMNSTRKGICLIVNNMMFWDSGFQNRPGCDIDEKSLEKVFESFNFLVKLFRNLSAGEIQAQLEHLSQKTDHTEYNCLVICLMSHGTIGRIYGVDGNSLSIHELTSLFTADNCPSLAGKPKLFFIQACRGEDYQKGYVLQRQSIQPAHTDNGLNNLLLADETTGNFIQNSLSIMNPRISVSDAKLIGFKLDNLFNSSTALDTNSVQLIPAYADFLLSYATVAGFRAQRDPTGGTVYIQALCRRLHRWSSPNESLLDIVTAVHREVSKQLYQEMSSQQVKENTELFLQIPEVRHTLTKKICFKR